jgi:cytochrome c556
MFRCARKTWTEGGCEQNAKEKIWTEQEEYKEDKDNYEVKDFRLILAT